MSKGLRVNLSAVEQLFPTPKYGGDMSIAITNQEREIELWLQPLKDAQGKKSKSIKPLDTCQKTALNDLAAQLKQLQTKKS
ncbi:hypothetical protein [Vibrio owensii]|uniref:hypothetical protein n=1 Tax=Vibrio owensii TaxID=696485 RepID=UPI0018F205D7|nr:hypothetical protein [Vibrio owensii]